MINEEKLDGLISYLSSLGFEGEKLEADIRDAWREYNPAFTVNHRIAFGDELMRYKLRFVNDRQFTAYRLAEYEAIHRDPVPVEHKVIDGIDTADLERRMGEVDWERHFGTDKGQREPDEKADAIASDLNRLIGSPGFDGRTIASKLLFKYWPKAAWDNGAMELHEAYEVDRTFTADESGLPNATLAYHTVSGRLDELHGKLRGMGLEEFPGIDLHGLLQHYLSDDFTHFDIRCSASEQEGIIDFHTRVIGLGQAFEPGMLSATLIRYPSFTHGVYGGVDTLRLDQDANTINWKDPDALLTADKHGDFVIRPEIADILERIAGLSGSGNGKAATYFYMKHIRLSGELEDFIPGNVHDILTNLPKVAASFPGEFNLDTRSIYNLLCGRPVMERSEGVTDVWLQMVREGAKPIRKIEGLTRGQLQELLDMVPLDDPDNRSVRKSIMDGNLTEVELRNGKRILLRVGHDAKSLKAFTPDMEDIPVNLNFDPGWTPADRLRVPKSQQKRIPNKGKSKGI